MSEKYNITFGSTSFLTLLSILFIALKLLDKITWSWLWVLSPLWMPIGIGLFIIGIFFIIIFIVELFKK